MKIIVVLSILVSVISISVGFKTMQDSQAKHKSMVIQIDEGTGWINIMKGTADLSIDKALVRNNQHTKIRVVTFRLDSTGISDVEETKLYREEEREGETKEMNAIVRPRKGSGIGGE